MRAAVLSIGDELVCGQTVDANAAWLSGQLVEAAVATVEHRAVGDDRVAIAAALREMAARCDLLLLTGGLGPTADDLTRYALGDVLTPGQDLVTDTEALARLERRFARWAAAMPASNAVQAQRPATARLLANPAGTAPGIAARLGGCRIYAMPGPPVEMRRMFRDQVRPDLELAGDAAHRTAMVHAFGLGESAADERLGRLMERGRNPRVGLTHGESIVTARIRGDGDREEAGRQVDATRAEILATWAPYAYGCDGETLAHSVGALLRDAGRRLATAESCTGGWLGKLIVDVPGSSDYYDGGWITYSNDLKRSCLGVPAEIIERHGAVSAEAARAMACGALAASGADDALAVTGVAGPAGGTAANVVGTVYIALARRGASDPAVRRFRFPGDRLTVRDRSAKSALQMLRWALLGVGGELPLLWETPLE